MTNRDLLARVTSMLRSDSSLTNKEIVETLSSQYKPQSIRRTYYEAKEKIELEEAKELAVYLHFITEDQNRIIKILAGVIVLSTIFFVALLLM